MTTTTEQDTHELTDADRAVARKAHAILVLLGAAWSPQSGTYAPADPANVTLEHVEEMIARLLATARNEGSEIATSGGLIVSGDAELGYDLSISIGALDG